VTTPAEINEAEFEKAVLKSAIPVLVDFWAERCPPCRLLEPVIDELADEYGGKISFIKINRDENPGIANRYNVMSIPTVIVFKNGRPVSSSIGFTKETRRALRNNIGSVL
jgi:thioredoxin 1